MSVAGIFRPGMRTYFVPLVAGLTLVGSAFLPWVTVGDVVVRGVPDVSGLWVAGIGVVSTLLAFLSLVTRKNSRHPLLVLGLMALAIMLVVWRVLPRLAGERAQTVAQAFAIVEDRTAEQAPPAVIGSGIYIGLAAAAVIAAFGLTIVIRRASQPYAVVSPDDDV